MSGIEDKSHAQHNDSDQQFPEPVSRHRGRWLLWAILLLLLIAAVIAFVVMHKNETNAATAKRAQGAAKATVTATVATAKKGNIGVYLDAIGTVTPVNTTSIIAQASGVLTAVHYSEGQFVKKGDVLI